MNKNEPKDTETLARNSERATRLVYETPELTAYNQSQITRGGVKSKAGDFVPGGGTSYKS